MSEPSHSDWRELFRPTQDGNRGTLVTLYVVRRDGQPWLMLPASSPLAAQALLLYPAQSAKARWARRALYGALRIGLRPRLERMEIFLSAADPFVKYLQQTARLATAQSLQFALLAGNPRAAGRRHVLLVFGPDGRPATVIKAGVGDAAGNLISRERDFLRQASPTLPGLPQLRGEFNEGNIRALALDCFSGQSPGADENTEFHRLMNGWLARDRSITLNQLGVWRRLLAASRESPLPPAVQALGELQLHPALFHGDFAPWNIKSHHGRWTVLDWERGEITGPPAWDWFHYIMQPALLVRRESPPALFGRFVRWIDAPAFVDYARAAGLAQEEHRRALGLAYLAYCRDVTRQTEGATELRTLYQIALQQWGDLKT